MTVVYGIAPGLRYRRLDGEVAVYLADRFQTCLLDDIGWQVLEAVQQLQAVSVLCTVDSLVTRLLAELPGALPSDIPGAEDPSCAQHAEALARLLPVLDALTQTGVLAVTAC